MSSLPDDVVEVPFGWTPEIEAERNNLLTELGLTGVSALPCLVFHVEEKTVLNGDEEHVIPAHWRELRISDLDKPWTWDKINAAEEAVRNAE